MEGTGLKSRTLEIAWTLSCVVSLLRMVACTLYTHRWDGGDTEIPWHLLFMQTSLHGDFRPMRDCQKVGLPLLEK